MSKKVYIVMSGSAGYGQPITSADIEKVFDKEIKAIKYINDVWSKYIVDYNTRTGVYSRDISLYVKEIKFIEEREVQ